MAREFGGIYAGGSWVGTAARFADLNPADGSVWAEIPDADVGVTRKAIETADAAFAQW